jgi:hypothetical protein
MNATAQQTEPNTHEMVVIHRIFRREFPLLAGIVPRASTAIPGGPRTSPGTSSSASIACTITTPPRTSTCGRSCRNARPHAELVRRMKVQHEGVAQHSEQARQLTGHWQVTSVPQKGTELAATLSALGDALAEYLDEE